MLKVGVMCLSSRCSARRKRCKCSFSNWFCLFDNSRLSLPVVHILREDSDFAIKSQLRKLLTKEDVQNKDRMAVEPITRLFIPAVLKVLCSSHVDPGQIQVNARIVTKLAFTHIPSLFAFDPMENSSSWTTLH